MAGIPIDRFQYPPVLTSASWKKKKGTLLKVKKTGLGAALTKAENLFKKVDVNQLNPGMTPSKTLDQLEDKVGKAKAHYAKTVPPVMKEMAAVKKAAQEAQKTLGTSRVAKSAVKAAAEIEKAAGVFAITCKSLDLDAEVARVKDDIERKVAESKKKLAYAFKIFASGSKAFLKDPSFESWESNVKQQGRSVSNCVAQIPQLREKYWSRFQKFKGFDMGTLKLDGRNEDEQAAQAKLAKLVQVVKLAQVEVKKIAGEKL